MTLLLENHFYTSRSARRCGQPCSETPRKRTDEVTRSSAKETTDLMDDLLNELSHARNTRLLSETENILADEDYVSWTGWTIEQLRNMAMLIVPYMRASKHRTPFEAVCLFWINLKTNLSLRQIGTLFKISTSEESIRRRIEDTFHNLNHLTGAEALNHHTSYSKVFFGDQLSIIWDGTYIYCNKSNDQTLQRD
ncbi:unnamed protein product [Adineta ricciae]|uniref:Transposase Helix-turn-helix domain-containing protein n=1 Tax=Adineta ricciae TaxID=249248 RepID=A0A815CVX3_ADIRI|nr:unnamed protein product [Adineta ricciae]